jgi:hypothetical protein
MSEREEKLNLLNTGNVFIFIFRHSPQSQKKFSLIFINDQGILPGQELLGLLRHNVHSSSRGYVLAGTQFENVIL